MTAVLKPIVELQRDDVDIANDIATAANEARDLLATLDTPGYAIESVEEKEFIEATMQQLASKAKFLDDERKVSTKPLNDEVARINDWYRPALETIKQLSEQAKRVLGAYILKQKREAERLAAEAQAKVQAALAASAAPAPTAAALTTAATEAKALMTQSAQASQTVQSQKGSAVTHKPVWKFSIKNPALLPREFLKPDEKAIQAHVAMYGNEKVPAGVEVFEDVSFRISKK